MGCGSVREDIEDQIMLIRLKKMKIQMEREKNLKLLSELEGHPINMDNISEYLVSSKKGNLLQLNLEQNNNINEIGVNDQSNIMNNNINKIDNNDENNIMNNINDNKNHLIPL